MLLTSWYTIRHKFWNPKKIKSSKYKYEYDIWRLLTLKIVVGILNA